MSEVDWIAVDWGTTALRAWIVGGTGTALGPRRSDRGMAVLAPEDFEPALLDLVGEALPAGRTVPVLVCGTAGTREGWREVPYRTVPCAPPGGADAARVATRDPRIDVRILPGMSQSRPADVMRGEETQIAGVLAARPGYDGVICLPGTHTKWAEVSAGEVVSFRTFMTGELFALLSERSILRHTLSDGDWDAPAFTEAVDAAIAHPARFAADLFALRAGALLDDLPASAARARLSGLLIGLELGAARPYWLGQPVILGGEGAQADAYTTALGGQGVTVDRLDATQITLAGLAAARGQLRQEGS
ncbi:2-keto-3-deoxy-galactonokinase [Roseivivax jejudonensis]|uniref:2-keto-3-deoxy-galactonokinase n=1 Tax=Roseivivax jejudonensis TaxID=1529041 RepID=A0A1X6ZLU2_9RHOB|nr:2-dehydro-3-deoxygalactonokinase [Roseivivax jejudonensis]SLN55320.1 2-keto-3-deoxy-galactonokinase [Roseivivax jejudonensis]